MKIGFLTSCLPQVSLENLVKWASENNFQSLELAAWPVESDRDYQAMQIDAVNFDKDEAKEVKDLFNQYNISTLQENDYDQFLSIEHEDPVWEGSEEKIKSGLKIAHKHLTQFL